MEISRLSFQISNVASACILGASLMGAASILKQKPEAIKTGAPIEDGRPQIQPPIAQDSVAKQFHDQVLGSSDVRVLTYNNKTYPLADVKVKQVIYTAKIDQFGIYFQWVWSKPMPFDHPNQDVISLSNDGYGHYYGSTIWRGEADFYGKSADINIR